MLNKANLFCANIIVYLFYLNNITALSVGYNVSAMPKIKKNKNKQKKNKVTQATSHSPS